jgi:hypothetical protein
MTWRGIHAGPYTRGFLDLLVERTHDTSAFTRARVLQTWSAMAEKKAIPLSHWLTAGACTRSLHSSI